MDPIADFCICSGPTRLQMFTMRQCLGQYSWLRESRCCAATAADKRERALVFWKPPLTHRTALWAVVYFQHDSQLKYQTRILRSKMCFLGKLCQVTGNILFIKKKTKQAKIISFYLLYSLCCYKLSPDKVIPPKLEIWCLPCVITQFCLLQKQSAK